MFYLGPKNFMGEICEYTDPPRNLELFNHWSRGHVEAPLMHINYTRAQRGDQSGSILFINIYSTLIYNRRLTSLKVENM